MDPKGELAELYDQDFYAWTQRASELLRRGCFAEADIEHVAEEIEDMGKEKQHALKSQARRLMVHLLKWEAQPAMRSRSWRATIVNARTEIADILEENPSLQQMTAEVPGRIYGAALEEAMAETGLGRKRFPASCPYTFEQLMDHRFPPPEAD
ncbi:MAG TPA: DUF29 domain-containing protein [Bryobacteraceae bacterium]|nr:DUF29 domain-containing protein [Bryobacteraceae bacterium]